MYSLKSYQLTVEEYNYLLPVLRHKLSCRPESDRYYFTCSFEDLSDVLCRLKGLYINYDESRQYECKGTSFEKQIKKEVKNIEYFL